MILDYFNFFFQIEHLKLDFKELLEYPLTPYTVETVGGSPVKTD